MVWSFSALPTSIIQRYVCSDRLVGRGNFLRIVPVLVSPLSLSLILFTLSSELRGITDPTREQDVLDGTLYLMC